MRMTILMASGGSIGGPVLPSARKHWLGASDRGHGPTPDVANGRTFLELRREDRAIGPFRF